MHTFEDLAKAVNRRLSETAYPGSPENLYAPISYAMSSGGKRVRPVLLLLACDMYGGDIGKALEAAAAVETYHNYTLLHDDLMDNADMRRGRETVHKRWDANTAVLSGDVMLALAYRRLISAGTGRTEELVRLFTQTAIEVGEGQRRDMDFESRLDVTEDEYVGMIRQKTAALIACAAEMGALIGGAPPEGAGLLHRFGEMTGIAFQLQDDCLDVYGDPEVFGKKRGGDILCNKKTYLLIRACSKAEGRTRAELLRWITSARSDGSEKIRAVTDIYGRLGVAADAAALIGRYFKEAESALGEVPLPDGRKHEIRRFVYSLMGRVN